MRSFILALATLFAFALPVTAQNARPLDPNSATEAQIAAIAGLAPLAATIIAKRPYAGPAALDAVLAAGNLSPDQRKAVYPRLWVPLNLNTATAADIMLVPGMSPRMSNEFREYRPYRSIEQFRYEIGKYVPKTEVARFEQYVFVPDR